MAGKRIGLLIVGDNQVRVVSDDGSFVAFASNATNLVSGDTNLNQDIFVRGGLFDATRFDSYQGNQVSAARAYPALSADGTKVAFESSSGQFVPNDTSMNRMYFCVTRLLTRPPACAVQPFAFPYGLVVGPNNMSLRRDGR